LVEENYFLACLKESAAHPGIQRLRAVLAGERWRDILADLPGYQPVAAPGRLLGVEEALNWWRRRSRA
jgi:putative molybdopterin biosynthesis protein